MILLRDTQHNTTVIKNDIYIKYLKTLASSTCLDKSKYSNGIQKLGFGCGGRI